VNLERDPLSAIEAVTTLSTVERLHRGDAATAARNSGMCTATPRSGRPRARSIRHCNPPKPLAEGGAWP
jgi:hypothetical protein